MSMGKLTYPEIMDQPAAIAEAYRQIALQSDWIGRYLNNDNYERLVFIGSGSSYYQAQVMAATYRLWTGREAIACPSSELFLFRRQTAVLARSYLAVGVSRSGESTEVLLALDSVRALQGWTICGITCHEDSSLAAMAPCLVSPLGKEDSTVMTKSFSSMTFMMQTAIAAAVNNGELTAQLEQVVGMDGDVVARADRMIGELVRQQHFDKYIYLGMGAYSGLAQEASLKIKEMSYVWTESFGTLEFRHGPKSIVEPGTLICVLLSEQGREYELKAAHEMKGYGAHILLITAREDADTAFADTVFTIGGAELSDEARSVLYLPALQLLGYYTALQKGVDPDHPRNLTQVVII